MNGIKTKDLVVGLEQDAVVPSFQPLVDLRSGQVLGAEILARWIRPDGKRIPPSVFVPLAEKAGLIGQLTEQILRRALAAASSLPSQLSLSLNVSPLQLQEPSLPELMRESQRTLVLTCPG